MPLYVAGAKGHIGIVELVTKRGAEVSRFGTASVDIALKNGRIEIVKLLISKGAQAAGHAAAAQLKMADERLISCS